MEPQAQPADIPALLQRLHAGDEDSIPLILERIMPWLKSYVHSRVRGRLRGRLETEDVVQDAIANFLRDTPKFVVQGEKQFRAFIRQVVDNVIRGHFRYFERQRRRLSQERPLSDLTQPVFHMGTPSQAASRDESEARVRLALEMIEPIDQRIICMSLYDDCTFREIGESIGMREDAVRQRYRRGLKRLQEKVRHQQTGDIWGFLGLSESQLS